jgi:hypothetical protein
VVVELAAKQTIVILFPPMRTVTASEQEMLVVSSILILDNYTSIFVFGKEFGMAGTLEHFVIFCRIGFGRMRL